MKKYRVILALTLAISLSMGCDVQSQSKIGELVKALPGAAVGVPSSLEMSQGLKQALELGVAVGTNKLSAKDGFLGDIAVKILMPPEAQKVEKTLRSLGLNALCDQVVTSLNRAAEQAVVEAKPIFVSAIKQMTISDAKNILLGNPDAATSFFKRVTTAELTAKFSPIVAKNLNEVQATKYWADLTSRYNKIPLVKPINSDLTGFVTQKAIDGLFLQIAKEELKIRDQIGARSSGLLQKVFGYADRNKN